MGSTTREGGRASSVPGKAAEETAPWRPAKVLRESTKSAVLTSPRQILFWKMATVFKSEFSSQGPERCCEDVKYFSSQKESNMVQQHGKNGCSLSIYNKSERVKSKYRQGPRPRRNGLGLCRTWCAGPSVPCLTLWQRGRTPFFMLTYRALFLR